MDYLFENSKCNNEVILSFSNIINILGLVNNTYSVANCRKKELSEILNIELQAIYYFYNNTRSEFKSIIERALNNLQKRSILEYNNVYMLALKDDERGKIYRKATNEEVGMIIDAKNSVLEALELKDFQKLFLSGAGIYKKFNKLVKAELPKDWIFYYQAYSIVLGKNAIKKEYEFVQEQKLSLNKKSIDRLNKHLNVISDQDNEYKLINKLISIISYDFNLDERLKDLYAANMKAYYDKINEGSKEIDDLSMQIVSIQKDLESKKIAFEKREDIDKDIYLSYVAEVKQKKFISNNLDLLDDDIFDATELFG